MPTLKLIRFICALVVTAMVLATNGVSAETNSVSRVFRFPADTLAYANQLAWAYPTEPGSDRLDPRRRSVKPTYSLRCFVMVRSARQFYDHARFELGEPKADLATYRHLVRRILARSTRRPSPERRKIVVPGYASLREFSASYEALLKAECGPARQSFLQRGNWRMVFPFSRSQQERTAGVLFERLRENRPVVAHAVCFPALTLNHGVLLFSGQKTEGGYDFEAYDPNGPSHPIVLRYDRQARRFYMARNEYFKGGWVNVYEVYRGPLY